MVEAVGSEFDGLPSTLFNGWGTGCGPSETGPLLPAGTGPFPGMVLLDGTLLPMLLSGG